MKSSDNLSYFYCWEASRYLSFYSLPINYCIPVGELLRISISIWISSTF